MLGLAILGKHKGHSLLLLCNPIPLFCLSRLLWYSYYNFYSTPINTLTTKMIEYLSFLLQCTSVTLLGATTCYLYSLLKMAEASINDLLPEVSYNPLKSDMKQEKLIECVLTGNSKQYLGKAYTKERVDELSAKEVDKLFSNYKAKLLGKIVKSLGKSIIRKYSMGACTVLGMSNQDALSKV